MPTYDYECLSCGYRFERRQNMADRPIAHCPECGGKVRKLIGAPAGIVKGSGAKGSEMECGKDATCCGRQIPCAERACDD